VRHHRKQGDYRACICTIHCIVKFLYRLGGDDRIGSEADSFDVVIIVKIITMYDTITSDDFFNFNLVLVGAAVAIAVNGIFFFVFSSFLVVVVPPF
jgi:hypothetical protein